MIGKSLGAKKTIARISSHEFNLNSEIDFNELGIDSMISPGELAADEIKKDDFIGEGSIQLRQFYSNPSRT